MDESSVDKVIVRLGFEEANGSILTYEYSYQDFKKGIQIKQPDGVQIVFVSHYSDYRKFDIIVQILETVVNKSFGNVVAVVFVYKDNSREYISTVTRSSKRAINTMMMIGDLSEGKSFGQLTSQESWRGMPAIGSVSDYVTITMAEIDHDVPIPIPPEEPEPPDKPSEVGPEKPKPPIIIEPEVIPESPTFRPEPPIEGKPAYSNKTRRNARYRGPRESDKEFSDHEEVRLDLEKMNAAMNEITSIVNNLLNNLDGKGLEETLESNSPIISKINRIIDNSATVTETEADNEIKRIYDNLADAKERADYYARTIHEKS